MIRGILVKWIWMLINMKMSMENIIRSQRSYDTLCLPLFSSCIFVIKALVLSVFYISYQSEWAEMHQGRDWFQSGLAMEYFMNLNQDSFSIEMKILFPNSGWRSKWMIMRVDLPSSLSLFPCMTSGESSLKSPTEIRLNPWDPLFMSVIIISLHSLASTPVANGAF